MPMPLRIRPLVGILSLLGLSACARTQDGGGEAPTSESPAPTAEGAPARAGIDPTDLPALGAAMAGPGLDGWMHAAVPAAGLYVFTYRRPGSFFDYVDLPLVPDREAAGQLASLRRHDKVRIHGSFIEHGAAKPHVRVTSVEVLEAYDPEDTAAPRDREVTLPDDLPADGVLLGKVHAVDASGAILVVEWKDAVVPVQVDRPELVAELWRNDKIRLRVVLAGRPGRPTHLRLDPSVAAPVELLDRVQAGHGKPAELEGELVLFPDSPQLKFEVYAVQVVDGDGVPRNYTLVNFEDMEVFEAIRTKLAAAWRNAPQSPIDGRNKLRKPGLRVRARGTLNIVSAAQANPQILLSSPDAISVESGPKRP